MNKAIFTILLMLHTLGFSATIILKNRGYEIFWDTVKDRAIYSRHTISRFKPTYFPRSDFQDDLRVENEYAPNEFYGTGYDRGHLVPFADLLYDQATAKETFLMTNITPQKAELNRGKWLDLERYFRHRCKQGQTFTIYTGPIYESDKIPIAFYKIAINNQTKETVAYVLPNRNCSKSLSKYKTTVEVIEQKIQHKVVDGVYQMTKPNKNDHWLILANVLLFSYLLYRRKK
ncbi:MAG: DNA/RNA non-specific endonuclease [Lentisphaeria bacterium]|nr:DNA/RNA non-specific endonuclease [Lentisphaeria bacterium]